MIYKAELPHIDTVPTRILLTEVYSLSLLTGIYQLTGDTKLTADFKKLTQWSWLSKKVIIIGTDYNQIKPN